MKNIKDRYATRKLIELIRNAPSSKSLAKVLKQKQATVCKKLNMDNAEYRFSDSDYQKITEKFNLTKNYFVKK